MCTCAWSVFILFLPNLCNIIILFCPLGIDRLLPWIRLTVYLTWHQYSCFNTILSIVDLVSYAHSKLSVFEKKWKNRRWYIRKKLIINVKLHWHLLKSNKIQTWCNHTFTQLNVKRILLGQIKISFGKIIMKKISQIWFYSH